MAQYGCLVPQMLLYPREDRFDIRIIRKRHVDETSSNIIICRPGLESKRKYMHRGNGAVTRAWTRNIDPDLDHLVISIITEIDRIANIDANI
jgi:hypothetical protein